MFLEARKASGKATTAPSTVPRKAMASVSPMTLRNIGSWSQPVGGKSWATTTEPNLRMPSMKFQVKKPKR